MARKLWTLILLATLAVTPPAAVAAQQLNDPSGFVSLVANKLCADTSPRDVASPGVRRCASQAVSAATDGKPFPWDCCHALLAAATGAQKRCACDFVGEAASRLKLDVNKDCQFLQKFVADEFLFGSSADKFCARN